MIDKIVFAIAVLIAAKVILSEVINRWENLDYYGLYNVLVFTIFSICYLGILIYGLWFVAFKLY